MIRLPKEMPKKLEELINIRADLAGSISNLMTMHSEGYCVEALMKALKAVTKGTRLEDEAEALIDMCREIFEESN